MSDAFEKSPDDMLLVKLDAGRRGGYTQRFHTVRRILPETVGQHVYGGLAILHALTDGAVSPALMWAWVFHDAPEAEYGDIPSPSKKNLSGDFRGAWNVREVCYNVEHGLHHPLEPREQALLNLVDCLDGLHSCCEERRLGNANIAEPFYNFLKYSRHILEYDKAMYAPSVVRRAHMLVNAVLIEWHQLTGDVNHVSK